MKKVLTICLVLVMAMCLCASVVASANGFMTSPSGKPAPEIIEFKAHDPNCTARLVITPYGERVTLPETLQKMIEKAFKMIVECDDLTELNADLKALAAELNIPGDKLAVSELFDIHMEGCDYHEEHKYFDIILSADALEHFVGLLHMRQDGEFELVADAKVTHDGDHLEFTVESFSPFAIVVDTSKNSPTGDNSMIFVCLALMLVSGVAVVLINRKPRVA